MLFKKEHIIPMILRRKVETRRKIKRKKGQAKPTPTVKVGNIYKAQERMFTEDYFCKFEVTNLQQGILGEVTEDDALREGYNSIEAFQEAWVQIHDESYNAPQKVWVITFEVVEVPASYDRILEIVPRGTEEDVTDLEYMLTKYPQLKKIIYPDKERTREEAYEVVFNPETPEEEEQLEESEFEFEDEEEVGGETEVDEGTSLVEALSTPPPKVEEEPEVDLSHVGETSLEEAQNFIELYRTQLSELQHTIDDAQREIYSVQRELGRWLNYVSAANIRQRHQIKRSYER